MQYPISEIFEKRAFESFTDYGKSNMGKSYIHKNIFQASITMAVDTYKPEDFQHVEDRIHEISNKIRDIRRSLDGNPLTDIQLNFGTFLHYIGELEKLVAKYKGELESQIAAAKTKAAREKMKAKAIKPQ